MTPYMKRPAGSNADEWAAFLECWGATPYSAVQIAVAIDERAATARAEAIRECAAVADIAEYDIAKPNRPPISSAILALLEKQP